VAEGRLVGLWDYTNDEECFGIICKIVNDIVHVQIKDDIITVPKSYVYQPGSARPTSPSETIKRSFWSVQGRWCRLSVHGTPVMDTELSDLNVDVF